MLLLKNIHVYNFRNISGVKVAIDKSKLAIVGPNGAGKTNLLLSMYYTAYTKVYRSAIPDAANIQTGADEMSVISVFEKKERKQKVAIEYSGGSKRIYVDDQPISRLSDYVGENHMVIITPDDLQIINGASEYRRGYLDGLLSKKDKAYLQDLIKFRNLHRTRNTYLKSRKGMSVDQTYLDAIDNDYAALSDEIYAKRHEIFAHLQELINIYYQKIAAQDDQIELIYESALNEVDAQTLLRTTRTTDAIVGRTTEGIHRDDIKILIGGLSAKEFASQGQKKSILFSMKLAEAQIIYETLGYHPIVMMDDVFEKLDDQRIRNLLAAVEDSQLIITDTSLARVEKYMGPDTQIINLN